MKGIILALLGIAIILIWWVFTLDMSFNEPSEQLNNYSLPTGLR